MDHDRDSAKDSDIAPGAMAPGASVFGYGVRAFGG